MEGANNLKKRRIWREEEEAKIEKFYALVKSIRESRDRLLKRGSGADGETENGNKRAKNMVGKEENRVAVAVWKPEFQVEDFVEEEPHHDDDQLQKYPPRDLGLAGSSRMKGAAEEKEEEKGMDLRLSL